jgi:hypothetical protein
MQHERQLYAFCYWPHAKPTARNVTGGRYSYRVTEERYTPQSWWFAEAEHEVTNVTTENVVATQVPAWDSFTGDYSWRTQLVSSLWNPTSVLPFTAARGQNVWKYSCWRLRWMNFTVGLQATVHWRVFTSGIQCGVVLHSTQCVTLLWKLNFFLFRSH